MKIAVMGSASSSVQRAPFKNTQYDEWIEGKVQSIARAHDQVAGDWEIWACSPGCWAVIPRATRFFEVHRWENDVAWFSPEYRQFLRDFKGPVYTGGPIPEIPNHVVYPLDYIEEKFSSYFLTSSLALMMALAIDTIEGIRAARVAHSATKAGMTYMPASLLQGVDPAELDKTDADDVIGLWGVDMAAADEYAYQRPGCQFFVLEAGRRGIGTYVPPESDLMRPLPVYGISEWDHNYIKLTARARELNSKATEAQGRIQQAQVEIAGLQGEQHALNYFVSTWISCYGMMPGLINRQVPGTGMGSGITSFDGRPVSRMLVGKKPESTQADVVQAMAGEMATKLLQRIYVEKAEKAATARAPMAKLKRAVTAKSTVDMKSTKRRR
jgi:hypothetical protein